MAYHFSLDGHTQIHCDSAEELFQVFPRPGVGSSNGRAMPGMDATTKGPAARQEDTAPARSANGDDQPNVLSMHGTDYDKLDLPLIEGPVDFDECRKIAKRLGIDNPNLREMRSALVAKRERQAV